MHIPDSMLQGAVCPVTAGVSAAGLLGAAYYGVKSKSKPSAGRFAAITALVFAGQMMNFPIMSGTSGHLLGGVLAASLLGVPFGVLAIALVVAIQSLIFADGGVTVLGANIFNMAILGAGVGGMLRNWLVSRNAGPSWHYISTAIAAWVSVVLASVVVSFQLAVDGQTSLAQVLPAMLGSHALIGIGEAVITVAVCVLLTSGQSAENSAKGRLAIPLLAAVVVALLLSPFASGSPDGLEWVAAKYDFLHDSAPAFVGVLPDYVFPAMSSEMLATGLAGLVGVLVCFGVGWLACRSLEVATVKVGRGERK